MLKLFLPLFLLAAACGAPTTTTLAEVESDVVVASGPRADFVVASHDVLWRSADAPLALSPATDAETSVSTLLVACALRADQSFPLVALGFDLPGESGFAPAWTHRPLSRRERLVVSACVMAHLTAEGLAVPVSLRGLGRGDASSSDERDEFPVLEGAFVGSLFEPSLTWAACRGPGQSSAVDDRGCTIPDPANPTRTRCGMRYLGLCDDVCDRRGGRGPYRGCDGRSVTGTTFVAE